MIELPDNPDENQLKGVALALIQSEFERGTITEILELSNDENGDAIGLFETDSGDRYRFVIEEKALSFKLESSASGDEEDEDEEGEEDEEDEA